ncbi:MAG: malto-oligosyltrehalose synthase [Gammaproteobacteria bacterium]|nr:malto-oligosyltrehalose synthase [Gammaproteobacteria bacterium]
MSGPRIPVATYRLQLNREFTFAQAAEVVPYLRELGISHCYVSPILRARAGSSHGYDVVDHSDLNPEIGTRADFDDFVAVLRGHGMGLIVDIVPNHMGVGGADNLWWLDVLENGEASEFGDYFDIDWRPAKAELRGKLLLPFLEDHYGKVLEKGLLALRFDAEQGRFGIAYHEHYFPLDPKTYPVVLRAALAQPGDFTGRQVLEALTAGFEGLPGRGETAAGRVHIRSQGIAEHKHALAAACRDLPPAAERIAAAVSAINGDASRPDSMDGLHRLLEQQAYRLAHWLVATDEINYRRFFDINALAGLRMERPEVFRATHRVMVDLARAGLIEGFRIDHPDGLFDPLRYFQMLQQAIAPDAGRDPAVYTVAEKILGSGEQLRAGWQVHGTTGYEFAAQLNGLFVYPEAGPVLAELYERFTGHAVDFTELLWESKKLVMRTLMSGELMVLANLIDQISEGDRHTRDYTLHALRDALTEVIACFPVYRTYISAAGVSEEDRQCIEQAVTLAKRRSPAADCSVFDFVRRILLLENVRSPAKDDDPQLHFVMKFQQYTAPVMAKGMEDTSFYAHTCFIALNEVGDDPRRFGFSTAAFHSAGRERQRNWPHTLLSTSTHDSKRSEDVRARLDVLSEMPATWRTHVQRWRRLNAGARRTLDGRSAPAREDEYLLYQTLVGAWPVDESGIQAAGQFRERIERFMLKAVREAKVHTSWINPDAEYEASVTGFVRTLLDPAGKSACRSDIARFARHVGLFGMLNSLAQNLIKLTAPGVPDIYQGNEIWELNLVDPDNRRPVDYERLRRLLEQLKALVSGGSGVLAARARLLLNTWQDGRVKLYVIWRALELRGQYPEVFGSGEYIALVPRGERAQHICAFARRGAAAIAVTVVPRWCARLAGERERLPLGAEEWTDTDVEAPAPGDYVNVFTGEIVAAEQRRGGWWLRAARVFARFPVALLLQVAPDADAAAGGNGLIDVRE